MCEDVREMVAMQTEKKSSFSKGIRGVVRVTDVKSRMSVNEVVKSAQVTAVIKGDAMRKLM